MAKHSKSGFGLLEVVIGVAIISITLFGLMAVSRTALRIVDGAAQNVQAGFLLEEGVEAIKIMRDSGWSANISTLSAGAPHYFNFDGSTWRATTSNIFIDGVFERSFIIENVYRDGDDDIAASGTLDQDTKKISVSVSWNKRTGTTTKTISTYIANLFNN
jgi:Tfp pilus assembly protein PilV